MKLGIIGGSGISTMAALAGGRRRAVATPWGEPSDTVLEGEIEGLPVAFLARHGPGHRIAPSALNYRANIAALKEVGCVAVLALSACGSFREALPPGHFCIPDQIVDRTRGRAKSFFDGGMVTHVSLAEPFATDLVRMVEKAAVYLGLPHQAGGVYLAMEGPQFSTRAESRLYRNWGMDVVGMTAMPEAALAREAEMAYALVAHVTDFDSWRDGTSVTTADVIRQLGDNVDRLQALVAELARRLVARPLPVPSAQGWERALDTAIISAPSQWTAEDRARLACLAPRFLA